MEEPQSQRWRVALGFGAASLLVLFAALPGLLGSWVGDDYHMVASRLYGDWAEIPRVFSRHAGHYLGKTSDTAATWPYRPVTMLTLLVPHALAPHPWLHHLVGWLMHIATGALLLVALLRQTSPRTHPAARGVGLVLVALFLLHPVTVEAYVFINGRSDLAAGLSLAALAAVLLNPKLDRPSRMVLVGAVAFFGAGSKVTFTPAALALWVGLALRSEQRRPLWRAGVPLGLSIAAYLGLRAANVPFVGRVGATENVARDFSAFADFPLLLAKSAAALVTFQAEAMQSLAWQLFQPFSALEWVGLIVFVAATVGLAIRRDFGGLALMAGFAVTVAPCVIVSRSIWIGFDRYLYMPLILALIAAAPYVVAAVEARPQRRALWWATAGVLVLISALGTRTSSLAYVNQASYERAMVADHPDDPSIVFYLALIAKKSGQLELARERLANIQEPPWPVAIVVPTVVVAAELSDSRTRDMAIEYGLQTNVQDPMLRAYAMRWKYERGELEDALALAGSFGPEDTVCPEVRKQLEHWIRSTDVEPEREQLREAALGLRCGSGEAVFK
jgi:hypothetical protein